MQMLIRSFAAVALRWSACAAAVLLYTACDSDPVLAARPVSEPLQRAMSQVAPKSRVLRGDEIDMRECEAVPQEPGLLRADFNGDGFEDAAALLVTSISSKTFTSDGVIYRRAVLQFVFFLNDGRGGYSSVTVDKYRNLVPAMMFLDLIPARREYRNVDGKESTSTKPAVALTFCGKSAAVYSLTGTRVDVVPLSE